MASDVGSLYDFAQLTLTTAISCLATTQAGAPAVSYISPASLPAFDCCPALIVTGAALTEEATSPLEVTATGHRGSFGRLNLATLIVWALRCGAPLDADGSVLTTEVNASAEAVLEDGWALWCGFYHAIINGTFTDLCSDVHFDRGFAIQEQGGCVGWQFQLRAELAGIPNPGPST
jgi:hypothetical protein